MPRMPKFQSAKPMSAKDLLENRFYDKYISELSEERDNKGYTSKWYDEQVTQLNKEYREVCTKAMNNLNARISELSNQINKAKEQYFTYTPSDDEIRSINYAKNLIKSRIIAETKFNPHAAENIINEFVGSRTGASAIVQLASDSQMEKYITSDVFTKAYSKSIPPEQGCVKISSQFGDSEKRIKLCLEAKTEWKRGLGMLWKQTSPQHTP